MAVGDRSAPHVLHERPGGPVVRGATLIALTTQAFHDAETAAEAKRLMREVLDHHLDARPVVSRRIVRDLMALDEEGPQS